jgi:hypothetical protein
MEWSFGKSSLSTSPIPGAPGSATKTNPPVSNAAAVPSPVRFITSATCVILPSSFKVTGMSAASETARHDAKVPAALVPNPAAIGHATCTSIATSRIIPRVSRSCSIAEWVVCASAAGFELILILIRVSPLFRTMALEVAPRGIAKPPPRDPILAGSASGSPDESTLQTSKKLEIPAGQNASETRNRFAVKVSGFLVRLLGGWERLLGRLRQQAESR